MIVRVVMLTAYAILWSVVFAAIVFVPVAAAAEYMNQHWLGINDDWILLTLPLGMPVGVWFAICSRKAWWLHLVCIPFGTATAARCFWHARELAERSDELKGLMGPFSGLAEALASLVAYACGILAVVVALAGVIGLLLCWQYRRLARRSAEGNTCCDQVEST